MPSKRNKFLIKRNKHWLGEKKWVLPLENFAFTRAGLRVLGLHSWASPDTDTIIYSTDDESEANMWKDLPVLLQWVNCGTKTQIRYRVIKLDLGLTGGRETERRRGRQTERRPEAADKTVKEGIYLKQTEGKMLREKNIESKPHGMSGNEE